MLDALRQIEREELIVEWRRLHAQGHDNPRTYARIAAAVLGLCSGDPAIVRLYHALGCDLLGLGADVWSALVKAHGAELPGLVSAALEALQAEQDRQDTIARAARKMAQERVETSERVRVAEGLSDAPLLPPGVTIAGWDLVRLAKAVASAPGDMRLAQIRQVFASAVDAHRAGRLGEWIDANPSAGAVWPDRG